MNDPQPLADRAGALALEELLEKAAVKPCLILLRHGRTEWNAEGRLQGQKDGSLDDLGRLQSNAFGKLLERVPLAQIHCSPLGRCMQTARTVAAHNVAAPEIVATPLLKEMALGLLEGELKHVQNSPEASACYRDLCKDEINYRVPRGGESLRDVCARVELFFEQFGGVLAADANHAIVAHRNVNKMIIKHLLGLSFEDGFSVEQENRRMYLFFPSSKELWSCLLDDDTSPSIDRGYVTSDEVYA